MDVSNAVSATQAAELLGISRQRVHQLIAAGKLEAVRVGSGWLVDKASVEQRKRERDRQ